MTLPRTDPLNPKPSTAVATRAVRIEKLVEDEIQEQIDASIPAQTLPDHSIFSQVHDNLYFLTVGSGLAVNIAGGRAQLDNVVYEHQPSSWTLAASNTSYIVITAVGAVFASTVPFQSGQIPLWKVTTDATAVQVVTDCRAVIARGGGTGSGPGAVSLDDAYEGGTPGSGSGALVDVNDGAVRLRNLELDTNAVLSIERSDSWMQFHGDRIAIGGASPAAADVALTRTFANTLKLGDNNPTSGSHGAILELQTPPGGTPGTPAGNTNRLYNALYGTNTRMFLKAEDAVVLGPLGDLACEFLFQRAQCGFFSAPHHATTTNGFYGLLGGPVTETGAAGTTAIDVDGRYLNYTQTAATTGLKAGFETAAVIGRRNNEPRFMVKVKVPTITTIRCFIGFSDQTLATMLAADNPAGNYFGFQFSTPRADTNWQYIQKNGTTQAKTSTSVAMAATSFYLLAMCRTGLAIRFDIWDSTFTLQQSSAGSILNPPTATTDMNFMAGIETEGNVLRPIQLYYGNVLIQKV